MNEIQKTTTGAEGVKWNLNDLYSGVNDINIERDIEKIQKDAELYEKKYRNKIKSTELGPNTLLKAIKELEVISEGIDKVLSYAHLLFASDTNNSEYGAFLQSIQAKKTQITKNIVFFELEWIKLPEKTTNKLIKNKKLAGYAHFLKHQRKYKAHSLSEPEEKILAEKANTGQVAFCRLFDEIINNIKFKIELNGQTQELTEMEVLALLYDPDREVRKTASISLTRGLEENSHVITYIFNTLLNDHFINDRLRSYPNIMSRRNLSNEIDEQTVSILLRSCMDNYGMVEKYYGLKKKFLNLTKMYDYDRYAPVFSKSRTVTYDEAQTIILDAFADFSPEMSQIAKMFFDNGWIDAESRKGKRGGAFSHGGVPSVHPYILVNYSAKMRDVMTLAHELGHGVHQYLSRKQGYFQSDTPLTTAETASVFAEMLVFDKLIKNESDRKVKLSLMCGKIEDSFATVFRQVVMTKFEETVHNKRRKEGELTKEKINQIWIDTNRSMFGSSVELTENYNIWWMYIPHFIHSPFYCYAYSFGELLVLALYQKYLQEGKTFVPKYLDMLSAGGSEPPEKIIEKVEVNIKDNNFWQGGLDLLSSMVEEIDELSRTTQSNSG